jgi:K319L-like, PKD domain/Fibronectin type III domain
MRLASFSKSQRGKKVLAATVLALTLFFFWSSVGAQTVSCIPTFTPGCVVTLSWVDNATNETEQVIERNLNGGAFGSPKTVGANITQVVDSTGFVQSATVDNEYCYRVAAANFSADIPPVRQQSAWSNTACFTVAKKVVNQAPTVNAGPDQSITLPALATLAGTVTDDQLPNPPANVTVTWSKVSGPGTVTFATPNAPQTTATFSVAGAYVLRLTANDSALQASDDIGITVLAAASVKVPSVPTGVTVTQESINSIRMSWQLNSTVANPETSIELERKAGKVITVIKGIAAGTTLYTDQSVAPATTYCYRIRALNSAGASAYSNPPSCGTTLAQ